MSESERATRRSADAGTGASTLPTWARWLSRSALWLAGLAATRC